MAHETLKKEQCGPRAKVVAHPCSKPWRHLWTNPKFSNEKLIESFWIDEKCSKAMLKKLHLPLQMDWKQILVRKIFFLSSLCKIGVFQWHCTFCFDPNSQQRTFFLVFEIHSNSVITITVITNHGYNEQLFWSLRVRYNRVWLYNHFFQNSFLFWNFSLPFLSLDPFKFWSQFTSTTNWAKHFDSNF